MAEGFGEDFLSLIHASSATYLLLREAYKALPLAIMLPVEYDVERGMEEIHESLMEAANLISDLPVDEVAGQLLFDATYHWLSATAAMRVYANERDNVSYSQIAKWNVTKAYTLADLAKAMLEEQG